MNIQWYPGHMTKTRRQIQADLKQVDLVAEIIDARIPISSRNPDIDELVGEKPRLIVLNRADQADPAMNKAWSDWFRQKGWSVLETNARDGKGVGQFSAAIKTALKEKLEQWKAKGLVGRPVRAMVVGIPNVGKSTFINSFAGRACAKTGNKPGVTKGAQWIRLNKQVELLDTPGILWPKFDDPQVGVRLAMLGSVNDEILNLEELASELAVFVQQHFPGALKERYKSDFPADVPSWMILGKIAEARGCLSKGGEPDLNKAASFLLDDFRAGRLGRITLEFPPDGKGTEER